MTSGFIWGDKPRFVNDSTRIDEAIDEAIYAHNDDPESHLEEGQALKSHRAAEIIDHLAESVVNDKLAISARAYVAIVGGESASDFDTVQEAINYAVSVGGGTVLILPGEYYLSGAIDFPTNINLLGTDKETVIIHGNKTAGHYFKIINDADGTNISQDIEKITFYNDGGGVFFQDAYLSTFNRETNFKNCKFRGGGLYISSIYRIVNFYNCDFQYNNPAALSVTGKLSVYNSIFSATGSPSSGYILGPSNGNEGQTEALFQDCKITSLGVTNFYFTPSEYIELLTMRNCVMGTLNAANFDFIILYFGYNTITLKTSTRLDIPENTSGLVIENNIIKGGSSPNLRIYADDCFVVRNWVQGTITNGGAGNYLNWNREA